VITLQIQEGDISYEVYQEGLFDDILILMKTYPQNLELQTTILK
jgi:hypothetical protein